MPAPASPRPLSFQAAVERPVSVVFRTVGGAWEGHDYRVEVIAEREGLDAFDVVMDFRDLEAALDRFLSPLNGQLLSNLSHPYLRGLWQAVPRIDQPGRCRLHQIVVEDNQPVGPSGAAPRHE